MKQMMPSIQMKKTMLLKGMRYWKKGLSLRISPSKKILEDSKNTRQEKDNNLLSN